MVMHLRGSVRGVEGVFLRAEVFWSVAANSVNDEPTRDRGVTTMTRRAVALTIAGVCVMAQWCIAADAPPRDQLGREVKLRILVDKVMLPEEEWVTKEWIVKETADAGFNVFSPRSGHARLDEVAEVTAWCEKYGIYHMPWMRGSLTAPAGEEADGKRMLWAIGEQPLWSPNTDEFWEWTTKYIVEYAKMSAENPHIMGVFLDYENYAKGPRAGNLYGLSYDDVIMGKFAAHKEIELPELGLTERKPWLDEQGLHEEFEAFQVAHWRERCRTLRAAVDEHDPTFMFCIYPAPGTQFMVRACYEEWATDQAPLILADPWTYGRGSKLMPQPECLEINRGKLERGLVVPTEAGINFIYSGGIDPIVGGADPEFSGKNALMISEMTGGYWIFYVGPKYTGTHPEYFKWFKWANDAIVAGDFAKYHEPRETPEEVVTVAFDPEPNLPRLAPPQVTGETLEYPMTRIRGDTVMLVATEVGQQVEIVLRDLQLGRYTDPLGWELRDAALNRLDGGVIPLKETGTVKFTAEAGGIYVLGASAGQNTLSVLSSNAPIALFAGSGLGLISHAQRLYFAVPEGIEEFTLTARDGNGTETVRMNVYDPEDNLVATAQTTLTVSQVQATLTVGDFGGRAWAVELANADAGVLEDSRIILDEALPPASSLDPAHVFGMTAGE